MQTCDYVLMWLQTIVFQHFPATILHNFRCVVKNDIKWWCEGKHVYIIFYRSWNEQIDKRAKITRQMTQQERINAWDNKVSVILQTPCLLNRLEKFEKFRWSNSNFVYQAIILIKCIFYFEILLFWFDFSKIMVEISWSTSFQTHKSWPSQHT